MKYLALILALTTAIPANAGGPVIIDDPTEATTPDRNVVPFIIAGAVILALIAGQSGNCVQPEEPTAPPTNGGC